jgi:uncharacterized membrane protein YjjB (DUF3815 family)
VFCYTALSAAAVSALLPGWLILTAGLEIAARQPSAGALRLVYGLIYALFLGVGLQVGSDVVLAFVPAERTRLRALAQALADTYALAGNLTGLGADGRPSGPPSMPGLWTFAGAARAPPPLAEPLAGYCPRPAGAPWWAPLALAPSTAALTALQHDHAWRTPAFALTVLVACAGFGANHAALRVFPGEPALVGALAALAVGALGNAYARVARTPAYAVALAGILFLVPSVFGEAGGVALDGDGLAIGRDILDLTIGNTVGLFLSEALLSIVWRARDHGDWTF